ncbi:ribonuclease H-like domain-containing protein [Rhizophagus clarus]|uniref:Ribonuclease H-like domain-containing protein n=1 Tax=Rhizophagus clarus TaxID=94130 RepID=A0A8H3MBR2_9GLOM|nr:ribonuclease H-like domain-containing protein [Rhizophagus clarus]
MFTDGSLSHIGTPELFLQTARVSLIPTHRIALTLFTLLSTNIVKAHDVIEDNDTANNLAKAGALKNNPILINPRFISIQLATFIWNRMAPITKNIRKFCNTSTAAAEFTRLMNSSSYAPITDSILANLIDWDLTSKWIKHNPLDSPTSRKLSAIQTYKVKSATFHLPTLDKRQLFYPALYLKLPLLCPTYDQKPDTNDHIRYCVYSVKALFGILLKHSGTLINILNSLSRDTLVDTDLIAHLLIHNLFPKLLVDLISRLIPQHVHLRNKTMLDIFATIQSDIHKEIWSTHAQNIHDFEKSILNITKRDKKSYRSTFHLPKRHKSNAHKHSHHTAFPILHNDSISSNLSTDPHRVPNTSC